MRGVTRMQLNDFISNGALGFHVKVNVRLKISARVSGLPQGMILGVSNIEHILDCIVSHALRSVEQSIRERPILEPFSTTSHLRDEIAVQIGYHLDFKPPPLVNHKHTLRDCIKP